MSVPAKKLAALWNVSAPARHWPKRVAAAYLRMMGASQELAAKSVGRSERTIRLWESEPTWSQAREEARDLWVGDLEDSSRKAVLECIRGGDGDLALKVLERIDDYLRPATQRIAPTDPSGRKPYENQMNLESLSDADLATLESLVRRVVPSE